MAPAAPDTKHASGRAANPAETLASPAHDVHHAAEAGAPAPARAVCWPWLVAMIVLVGIIWGNSMVPGQQSGELSSGVLAAIRHGMAALGLPIGWLTEHIVRKAAHFTEYLCLGLLAMQALRPHRAGRGHRAVEALSVALLLVLTPLIDETIQLFSDGRGSMVSDVWIDICGATTGCLITLLLSFAFGALRPRSEQQAHRA